jgi:hypothetical protein
MSTKYLMEKNNTNIALTAHIEGGELRLGYAGADLSSYAGLQVGRDAGQTIEFKLDDFEHDRRTWVVSASPKLTIAGQAWTRGTNSVADAVSQYLTSDVEVEVEATATDNAEKKIQRVRIKTTPKEGMPDPRLNQ